MTTLESSKRKKSHDKDTNLVSVIKIMVVSYVTPVIS
jgi:hypothetical protein